MTLRVSLGIFLVFFFSAPFVVGAASTSDTTAIRQAQSLQAKYESEGNKEMAAKYGEMLKGLTKPSFEADMMCNPFIPQCPCGIVPDEKGKCTKKGANMNQCPCFEKVSTGVVTGKCVMANNCKGQEFSDLSGKTQSVGDSKGFMDALKGVMDLLKQAMQGQQQQQQPQTGAQGCTTYRQVSTPTTDPCSYYVPPTSDSLLTNTTGNIGSGVSDALLDALTGGTNINVSDQLLGAINPQPGGTLSPQPSGA